MLLGAPSQWWVWGDECLQRVRYTLKCHLHSGASLQGQWDWAPLEVTPLLGFSISIICCPFSSCFSWEHQLRGLYLGTASGTLTWHRHFLHGHTCHNQHIQTPGGHVSYHNSWPNSQRGSWCFGRRVSGQTCSSGGRGWAWLLRHCQDVPGKMAGAGGSGRLWEGAEKPLLQHT